VSENQEEDTIHVICREAKAAGKLSGDQLTQLYELFGSRFTKALDALKEGRAKKYTFKPSGRVVWVVLARQKSTYVLSPINPKTRAEPQLV
jgi:hypothetical protein